MSLPDSIDFEYFFGEESSQFSFFRIPRQLITNPQFKKLSTDAKLLYGMLLDRMGLSARNGWYDEQGRVYIYYTVDEIREDLCCGNDKALKMLAELDTRKGAGLIERVKQGQGRPTKIFVKRFTTRAVPPHPKEAPRPSPLYPPIPPSADLDFSDSQTSEKTTSRPRKSRCTDIGKTDASYNNQNHTDFSHTDSFIYPPKPQAPAAIDRYECREEIKHLIEFDHLRTEYPYDDVDSLLELIVDVVSSTAPTIRIGGDSVPVETVKGRFWRLDHSHIEYVLDALKKTTTQIHNIRAYLLTALYNAPVTIGPYYSAAVRHDFG